MFFKFNNKLTPFVAIMVAIIFGASLIAINQRAQPIEIQIEEHCDFGSQIEPFLDEAARDYEKKVDAEKSKVGGDFDGVEIGGYASINRIWNGLNIVRVGSHYEGNTIHFAQSATKVIEVLSARGLKFDANGEAINTDQDSMTTIQVYETKGEPTYGRAALYCGS